MHRKLYRTVQSLILLLFIFCFSVTAKEEDLDSVALKQAKIDKILDSIDATIKYQTGKVALNSIVDLDVPSAYKFVPSDKAQMILHDLWGNPEDKDVLGMIVKSDYSVKAYDEWVFVLSYSEDGYVKDEDADKIDYAELLKSMQESEVEENKERQKEGYKAIHILDWATTPYYNKEDKILHWAKKIQFGEDTSNITLNYDVRVLGRKGVLSMNAVGNMGQLGEINAHIPEVVKIAKFTDGNKYKDFNPSIDKVAAYTIGGLIAGKLIAKAGLFVILLKYIKLILLAIAGLFAGLRKRLGGFFSRKKDQNVSESTEDLALNADMNTESQQPSASENTDGSSIVDNEETKTE